MDNKSDTHATPEDLQKVREALQAVIEGIVRGAIKLDENGYPT
jgi:hypothetical protein